LEVRDTSSSDALLNKIKVLAVEQAIDSDGYTQFSIDTA
jgi:Flp pilus assembly protein CpaB